MKKLNCFLMLAIAAMLPFSHVYADPIELDVRVRIVDPNNNLGGNPRSPILIPELSIEDYTLYFNTPCDGCTLRLVDADGNTAYSTIIPTSCSSLVMPSTLSGTYELQIVSGNFCFYTEIEL